MSEIDDKLAEIRARLDPRQTHGGVFDFHAPQDIHYLLGLVDDLRRQLAEHDAEASAACQDWDARCQELERRLTTVIDLLPSPNWLETVAEYVTPLVVREQVKICADHIRAWREKRQEGKENA